MNRIKELRKQSGITQNKLCYKLSISQPTLSGWENGKFEPDQKAIFSMCEIFNVSSDYLLGRDTADTSNKSPAVPEIENEEILLIAKDMQKLNPEAIDTIRRLVAQMKGGDDKKND